MKVSAVILNFNNYADTSECLRSLEGLALKPQEVIVVDNGSTDGSLERLREEFPRFTFIRNNENLGYAGGGNIGITRALEGGAEAVWLLNNDTVVHPDALRRLAEAAESNPRAGILGSTIYRYDSPRDVHFAGGKLVKWKGRGEHVGVRPSGMVDKDRAVESDFATGASLLARADMIEEIGLMDEGYFLYMEDVDWAIRAKRAAWRVCVVPESVVWHKVSRTAEKNRPHLIYYVCRNSLYLCARYFPHYLPLVLAYCACSYLLAYFARWVAEGFDGRRGEYVRMAFRGVMDFFLGRRGEVEKRIGR